LHVPLPSQLPTRASTPAEHALVPHAVLASGYLHASVSVPLQRAAHEVPAPAPVHAGRDPCGAPTIAEQVPGVAPLQASHWFVQTRSQQTPSTQKPVAQSVPSVQVVPCFFEHVPLPDKLHALPAGHDPVRQQTPSTHVRPVGHEVPAQLEPGPDVGAQWFAESQL
jgi:hypothetical protein